MGEYKLPHLNTLTYFIDRLERNIILKWIGDKMKTIFIISGKKNVLKLSLIHI